MLSAEPVIDPAQPSLYSAYDGEKIHLRDGRWLSPAAKNAFTDHIDRGRETIDRAEEAVNAANAKIQAADQEAQTLHE